MSRNRIHSLQVVYWIVGILVGLILIWQFILPLFSPDSALPKDVPFEVKLSPNQLAEGAKGDFSFNIIITSKEDRNITSLSLKREGVSIDRENKEIPGLETCNQFQSDSYGDYIFNHGDFGGYVSIFTSDSATITIPNILGNCFMGEESDYKINLAIFYSENGGTEQAKTYPLIIDIV